MERTCSLKSRSLYLAVHGINSSCDAGETTSLRVWSIPTVRCVKPLNNNVNHCHSPSLRVWEWPSMGRAHRQHLATSMAKVLQAELVASGLHPVVEVTGVLSRLELERLAAACGSCPRSVTQIRVSGAQIDDFSPTDTLVCLSRIVKCSERCSRIVLGRCLARGACLLESEPALLASSVGGNRSVETLTLDLAAFGHGLDEFLSELSGDRTCARLRELCVSGVTAANAGLVARLLVDASGRPPELTSRLQTLRLCGAGGAGLAELMPDGSPLCCALHHAASGRLHSLALVDCVIHDSDLVVAAALIGTSSLQHVDLSVFAASSCSVEQWEPLGEALVRTRPAALQSLVLRRGGVYSSYDSVAPSMNLSTGLFPSTMAFCAFARDRKKWGSDEARLSAMRVLVRVLQANASSLREIDLSGLFGCEEPGEDPSDGAPPSEPDADPLDDTPAVSTPPLAADDDDEEFDDDEEEEDVGEDEELADEVDDKPPPIERVYSATKPLSETIVEEWIHDALCRMRASLPIAGAAARVARLDEASGADALHSRKEAVLLAHSKLLYHLGMTYLAATSSSEENRLWVELLDASSLAHRLCLSNSGLSSTVVDAWLAKRLAQVWSSAPISSWGSLELFQRDNGRHLHELADAPLVDGAITFLEVAHNPRLGLGSISRWLLVLPKIRSLLASAGTGTRVGKTDGVGSDAEAAVPSIGSHVGSYDAIARIVMDHPLLQDLSLPVLDGAVVNALLWGLTWRDASLVHFHADGSPRLDRLVDGLTAFVPSLRSITVGAGFDGFPWDNGLALVGGSRRLATLPTAYHSARASFSWLTSPLSPPMPALSVPPTHQSTVDKDVATLFRALFDSTASDLRVCRFRNIDVQGGARGLEALRASWMGIDGRRALHRTSNLVALSLASPTEGAPRNLIPASHQVALSLRRAEEVKAGHSGLFAWLLWARCRHPRVAKVRSAARSVPGDGAFQLAGNPRLIRRILQLTGSTSKTSTPLEELCIGEHVAPATLDPRLCRRGDGPARHAVPMFRQVTDLRRRHEAISRLRATHGSRSRADRPVAAASAAAARTVAPGGVLSWSE
jgi:hypothetical protein